MSVIVLVNWTAVNFPIQNFRENEKKKQKQSLIGREIGQKFQWNLW
jgi:hypothetical protein